MSFGRRADKGECTWPSVNSHFGALDNAGFWKDRAFWYQAYWTDTPVLHVYPGWGPLASADADAAAADDVPCGTAAFTEDRDTQGLGLLPPAGHIAPPKTESECAQACCTDPDCTTYNWCPPGLGPQGQNYTCNATVGGGGPQGHRCYIGVPQSITHPPEGVSSWIGGTLPGKARPKLEIFSNADTVKCIVHPSDGTGAIDLPTVAIPPLGNGVLSPPAYKPGSLHCTGYKNGSAAAFVTTVLTTPGAAAALRVTTEMNQTELAADGQDVALVRVEIVDANNNVVPSANHSVTFAVDGPASVVGVGNGDPHCHEPDRASQRSAFHGLARAIVQSSGKAGSVVVHATADGLTAGSVAVKAVGGGMMQRKYK